MTRVGFVLRPPNSVWLGGTNYLSNLVHAIMSTPDRMAEPVLLVPPSTSAQTLAAFPAVETIVTPMVDLSGYRHQLRRAGRVLGRDIAFELLLKRHRIDVLSHSEILGKFSELPAIGWIPDFQHRHLPEFFDATAIAARDRKYSSMISHCSTIVLSSRDAQNDCVAFRPGCAGKTRVLHFVSGMTATVPVEAPSSVLHGLGVEGKYFHLPNQFWMHKNHRLVVDALRLLDKRGSDIKVVATGDMQDHRNPAHFPALMKYVEDQRLTDRFRVLGVVPYAHLRVLMENSVALINPSLFEGWSTTVEEAKSLGKRVILSDIPVHKEQAPARGMYFDPANAERLAMHMQDAWESFSPERETAERNAAAMQLQERFIAFGRQYQEILRDTLRA